MNMNHSIITTKVAATIAATRADMVHSIGGPLAVAFPNWAENSAASFSKFYR